MRIMTDDEWRAFLADGTRTVIASVLASDGRPLMTPVWVVLDDDGTIVFTTGGFKAKALLRDPRICLCADDATPPYSFVTVQGTAELSDDVDEMLPWAIRIGARYMGAERGEEYGRRNAAPGELLVRVRPSKVVAKAGVSD